MKADLLDLIACPSCGGALTLAATAVQDNEVWAGELRCGRCTAVFPIQQGMPQLYVNDEKWVSKAIEAEGWVKIHKDLGIYEPSAAAIDLQIPYYPEEPWTKVSKGFDQALAQLRLTGQETVLDLGAGRGWAAKEFAKLGCRVVALDVVADENVGLGRAKAIMDHAGVYFDRIIADGENLPFQPNSFDLVFCAATLHHSSHLALFFENIHTALRPGGRLCAMHEPCISVLDDEAHMLATHSQHELDVGINETRPNFLEYAAALEQGHFSAYEMRPTEGIDRSDANLAEWAHLLGAVRPYLRITQPRALAAQTYHYYRRYLTAWRRGILTAVRQELARSQGRAHQEKAILIWIGGEMLLLAQKQPA